MRPEEREDRERRFRGEAEPCLPYLVASPTLELGVDIADLDIVHLRNLPPPTTPRGWGVRAGRDSPAWSWPLRGPSPTTTATSSEGGRRWWREASARPSWI
uniref:Helicase C-terminal domain-containing protein n=1 Tax=Thermus caliditerrae TaxID=1330700 RepID=A0A7C5VIM4_9DEIN